MNRATLNVIFAIFLISIYWCLESLLGTNVNLNISTILHVSKWLIFSVMLIGTILWLNKSNLRKNITADSKEGETQRPYSLLKQVADQQSRPILIFDKEWNLVHHNTHAIKYVKDDGGCEGIHMIDLCNSIDDGDELISLCDRMWQGGSISKKNVWQVVRLFHDNKEAGIWVSRA